MSSTDEYVFVELILFLFFLKQAEEQDEDDIIAIKFSLGGNKFHVQLLFNGSLVKTYGLLGHRMIHSKYFHIYEHILISHRQ